MKLEVGMYVRTTYGRIYKIEKIETTKVYYSCNPPELQWQDIIFVYSKSGVECEDAILKASHNIIDLIEVGDYVNGYVVLDKQTDNLGDKYIECGCKDDVDYVYDTFYNKDIKSIVTKEQFEAMQYKVV